MCRSCCYVSASSSSFFFTISTSWSFSHRIRKQEPTKKIFKRSTYMVPLDFYTTKDSLFFLRMAYPFASLCCFAYPFWRSLRHRHSLVSRFTCGRIESNLNFLSACILYGDFISYVCVFILRPFFGACFFSCFIFRMSLLPLLFDAELSFPFDFIMWCRCCLCYWQCVTEGMGLLHWMGQYHHIPSPPWMSFFI